MRFKLTLIELLVIVAIIGVLVCLLLPGSDFDLTHRYPEATAPGVHLANVAGDYYLGNGRGRRWRLSILPDGRYSFISSGCTGVHHRESGFAQDDNGLLKLTSLEPNPEKFPRGFLPICWDRRVYLIPPGNMEEFCDEIVKGNEPRVEIQGLFYLLQPWGRADGLPDLPAKWLDSLRKRITIGKIVHVNAKGTQVKVELGSRQEIRVGSLLTLQGDSIGGILRVISVEEDSCVALVEYPGECAAILEAGHNVVFARPDGG